MSEYLPVSNGESVTIFYVTAVSQMSCLRESNLAVYMERVKGRSVCRKGHQLGSFAELSVMDIDGY